MSVSLDPHTSLSTLTQVLQTAAWARHTNQHFYHRKQDSDFLLVMRFCQSLTHTMHSHERKKKKKKKEVTHFPT